MSIDKLLRIKIWSKVLLIVSVVLFLIGIGVIFGPALIHETDMNQDALEYSELSEETKTQAAVDSNLMVDEMADESLPHVTLVPPLEISDIPAGNNTLQELLEQSNEGTVTNNHVETKPDQERHNDGDEADGSDTVENQKPSGNTSAPENTNTSAGRDLNALKAQNSDFAGCLSIAGTNVDYPLVCSDNTDYYLTHTFNGTKSSLGTLFSLGKTDYGSSKNIAAVITKTDAGTGAALAGATFEVVNASGTVVATAKTGTGGTAFLENLQAGTYTIRETSAPTGYTLSVPNTQSLTVAAGQTANATFANEKIRGKIAIYKVDADSKEPLAGAAFSVTDANGNTVLYPH